jgi:hypothetical protein
VTIPSSPSDLLYEARSCLHAIVAVKLDDQPTMECVYAELHPAAAELARVGSGLLTLRPVAHYRGDLATALGRRHQAASHYRQALTIAVQAGAPHWADAARTALGDSPTNPQPERATNLLASPCQPGRCERKVSPTGAFKRLPPRGRSEPLVGAVRDAVTTGTGVSLRDTASILLARS